MGLTMKNVVIRRKSTGEMGHIIEVDWIPTVQIGDKTHKIQWSDLELIERAKENPQKQNSGV